ncbi:hypothetical protein C8J56DRAFT_910804 [Mycena floridula]|nr:hypothetical protein C8J56DRAFT_910804 [Mycena floridula]
MTTLPFQEIQKSHVRKDSLPIYPIHSPSNRNRCPSSPTIMVSPHLQTPSLRPQKLQARRSTSSPPRLEDALKMPAVTSYVYPLTIWFDKILSNPPPTDITAESMVDNLIAGIQESRNPVSWSELHVLHSILSQFLTATIVQQHIDFLQSVRKEEPDVPAKFISYQSNGQMAAQIIKNVLATHSANRKASLPNGSTDKRDGNQATKTPGGRGNNRGDDRGRGRNGPRRGGAAPGRRVNNLYFSNAPTIVIPVGAFQTPPGPTADRRTSFSRQFCSGMRSVDSVAPPVVYSPFQYSQPHIVSLFHGTHLSQLNTFLRKGVRPAYRPNELSDQACFYMTPSIAHAFVHPLFVKAQQHDPDPIIVLRFDVDPRILHGETEIPGLDTAATIKWYRGDQPEDVEEFIQDAAYNLAETEPPGNNGSPPSILSNWSHETDGHLTQIGCTERMWSYLNLCLVAIYQERRQIFPDP